MSVAASELCAVRGLAAGRAIRAAVHALPVGERGTPDTAALKPPGTPTQHVDRVAEDVGIACFERLAAELGHRIELIADVASAQLVALGSAQRPERVFAHLDAVDGTIKIGGLGNDLAGGRVRVANDGTWGVAMAFTAPTRKTLEQLTYRDFTTAVVVDGNPPRRTAFPHEVAALAATDGWQLLDLSDAPAVRAALGRAPQLFTSTNTVLEQSVVYWDGFQAFDRATRREGDEELAVELYRQLANRHAGGPYDIVRYYGNLSALLRVMLGWRGAPPWIESQGAGFVVVNENLPNLIPAVPIIAAAGGVSVGFDDRPLLERRLVDGRTSVVHAANPAMREQLLRLVSRARQQIAEPPAP
jgi:hypothetical protein